MYTAAMFKEKKVALAAGKRLKQNPEGVLLRDAKTVSAAVFKPSMSRMVYPRQNTCQAR
jgi:hypothetical protein